MLEYYLLYFIYIIYYFIKKSLILRILWGLNIRSSGKLNHIKNLILKVSRYFFLLLLFN